jgi:putative peptidoglycan lipid II flippase
MYADAFVVAFRIPNLLRDLFAEGALSQAFVPTFKATMRESGVDAAYALANRVAGTLFVFIGGLVLAAGILAPWIVAGIAGDFAEQPGKLELTTELTRIMLPFLPMVSLAAVAMGMLNSQDRYGAPALASTMFNVASIAVGISLYVAGVHGRWVAIGWSVGTLAGGLCQLAIQVPSLWRAGYRPRLRVDLLLRDPGVRRIGRLMLPAIAGLAAVQINIVVNTLFASSEDGANAWLSYAFRLMQLPIGVFGVAIATVSTTRYADAAADGDRSQMAAQLVEGLRLVLFLTVPATVGLAVLGEPIIRLLYEHGAFRADSTAATAAALRLYATGLVAYAAVKVIAPAFYAVDNSRVPILASMSAVAGNLAINFALHGRYGFRVLAFGVAFGALVNVAVLYVMFQRKIASIDHRQIAGYLVKVAVAAGAMGAAVWAVYAGIDRWLGHRALWAQFLSVGAPVAVGAAIYALACRLLRIEELSHYGRRLRRRRD